VCRAYALCANRVRSSEKSTRRTGVAPVHLPFTSRSGAWSRTGVTPVLNKFGCKVPVTRPWSRAQVPGLRYASEAGGKDRQGDMTVLPRAGAIVDARPTRVGAPIPATRAPARVFLCHLWVDAMACCASVSEDHDIHFVARLVRNAKHPSSDTDQATQRVTRRHTNDYKNRPGSLTGYQATPTDPYRSMN